MKQIKNYIILINNFIDYIALVISLWIPGSFLLFDWKTKVCADYQQKGQIIIEYVVMFTIIVIVIIWASTALIQPSVNKLFEDTATVINTISDDFVNNAYRWQ